MLEEIFIIKYLLSFVYKKGKDMKKSGIVCLAWMVMAGIFADEVAPKPPMLQEKKLKDRKETIIPYAQTTLSVPGAGVAYRMQNKYLGYQVDGNGSVFSDSTWIRTSLAAVVYPLAKADGKWTYGGWNMSVGLGAAAPVRSNFSVWSYVPIFMGYQGEEIFFDAGFNVEPVFRELKDRGYVYVFSEPSLKLGVCF